MAWVEVAPQISGVGHIPSLTVHNGKIYGGTRITSVPANDGGKLLEWNGTNAWVEKAPMLNNSSSIDSLHSYGGKLYGATGINLGVGGISDACNLLEWDEVSAWVQKSGAFLNQLDAYGLIDFNSNLYVGTQDWGRLLEWDNVSAWIGRAALGLGTSINDLVVFGGELFGVDYSGNLQKWDGVSNWVVVAGALPNQIVGLKLITFDAGAGSKIYAIGRFSSGSSSRLLEWDGVSAWIERGGLYVFFSDMTVAGGELYISTSSTARLYRWNKISSFTSVCTAPPGETHIYALATLGSTVYGTSSPSGKLFQYVPPPVSIAPLSMDTLEAFGSPSLDITTHPFSGVPLPPPISTEGDIRLGFDIRNQTCDLVLGDRDTDRDPGLETVVFATLLSDKISDDEDSLPDYEGYKGGWWGDEVSEIQGDRSGTKLWLLNRSKAVQAVPAKAVEYLKDGFQWMIDDGIVTKVDVVAVRDESQDQSTLKIQLLFTKPTGEDVSFKFFYNWVSQMIRR